MADAIRQYHYGPSPGGMVACLAGFGVAAAIGSYFALFNASGLTINGLITLNQSQATVFWWCIAGTCAAVCLAVIVLSIWWVVRGEKIALSEDGIQVPSSLFRRGVSLIRFDDLLAVGETVVGRQRMLNIAHRQGEYTIPANMVSAVAYKAIHTALVQAIVARGGGSVG